MIRGSAQKTVEDLGRQGFLDSAAIGSWRSKEAVFRVVVQQNLTCSGHGISPGHVAVSYDTLALEDGINAMIKGLEERGVDQGRNDFKRFFFSMFIIVYQEFEESYQGASICYSSRGCFSPGGQLLWIDLHCTNRFDCCAYFSRNLPGRGRLQVKWEMIQEEDMQTGLACQGCLFLNAKVELFWWSKREEYNLDIQTFQGDW